MAAKARRTFTAETKAKYIGAVDEYQDRQRHEGKACTLDQAIAALKLPMTSGLYHAWKRAGMAPPPTTEIPLDAIPDRHPPENSAKRKYNKQRSFVGGWSDTNLALILLEVAQRLLKGTGER